MRHGSVAASLTAALVDAAARGYDFDDCRIWAFWQAFGSTAGPWGGIGGAAITGFLMVVMLDMGESGPRFGVWCGGRPLYEVVRPEERGLQRLMKDIESGSLADRPGRYLAQQKAPTGGGSAP